MIEAKYIPGDGFMVLLNGLGKMKLELGGVKHNLIEKSANQLADFIRKNITTQKYQFSPLSEGWNKYKKIHGKHADDFWIYTGMLLKNIMAVQLEDNEWTVMVMSGVDSKGKDPAWYATLLETGKQPRGKPRPLFLYSYMDFKEKWNSNCKTQFERIRKAVGK